MKLPCLLALSFFSMLLPATSSQSQQQRGADVFMQSGCSHCHSIGNAGGTEGPDLSSIGLRLSRNRMRRQILRGGKEMPAFRDILRQSELNDLLTYLNSCRQQKDQEQKEQ
jgi:mono/diheme cytochrome c family protein